MQTKTTRRGMLAAIPAALAAPTMAATDPDERWAETTMAALLAEAAGLEGSPTNARLLAIAGLCAQLDVELQCLDLPEKEYDARLARLEGVQREAQRRMARNRAR